MAVAFGFYPVPAAIAVQHAFAYYFDELDRTVGEELVLSTLPGRPRFARCSASALVSERMGWQSFVLGLRSWLIT